MHSFTNKVSPTQDDVMDIEVIGSIDIDHPAAADQKGVSGDEKKTQPSQVDTEQQPVSVKKVVDDVINTIIEHGDMFPYIAPGHHGDQKHVQKSLFGVLGTIIGFTVMFWFVHGSASQYANDVTGLNAEVRPRFDRDYANLLPLGVYLTHSGTDFYDETYFRFAFRLRAIFEGDVNVEKRPRVYINVTPVTCQVYQEGKDTSSGKTVPKGCIDLDEVSKKLIAEREATGRYDDIPKKPRIQGEFGSDAYWFLEIKLNGCPSYGPEENITCANSTEIQHEFDKNPFTISLVLHSQVTREYTINSNIYLNLDYDRWTGVESFLQLTKSYETDRDLPRITKSPQNLLKYSQYNSRAQKKVSDSYITFYIRLYDQVREETIEHYTLLEMLSALGGAFGLVKLVDMCIFIPINKIIYDHHHHEGTWKWFVRPRRFKLH